MKRKKKNKMFTKAMNQEDITNKTVETEENIDMQNNQEQSQEQKTNEPVSNQNLEDQNQEGGQQDNADEKKCDEKEKLQMEVAAAKDKYIRLSAEFDNYRKRTLKEKIDLTKQANEDLLKDLLPVMDNFERALKSMEDAKSIEAVKEGVQLIYNRFKDLLQQKGVKEIDAQNKSFDTDVHEAITKIPAPTEEMKGKIVDVIEKGYYLNDKVMRFAKVVIGE